MSANPKFNPTSFFLHPTRLILLFFLLNYFASSTEGVCCPNRGNFQCCGVGSCNFFCCNCEGGCESECSFNPALLLAVSKVGLHFLTKLLGKVHQPNSGLLYRPPSENGDAASTFEHIDLNKDNMIDLSEGFSYLRNVTLGIKGRVADSMGMSKRNVLDLVPTRVEKEEMDNFAQEFNSMDLNGDGMIEPHEFDRSLA